MYPVGKPHGLWNNCCLRLPELLAISVDGWHFDAGRAVAGNILSDLDYSQWPVAAFTDLLSVWYRSYVYCDGERQYGTLISSRLCRRLCRFNVLIHSVQSEPGEQHHIECLGAGFRSRCRHPYLRRCVSNHRHVYRIGIGEYHDRLYNFSDRHGGELDTRGHDPAGECSDRDQCSKPNRFACDTWNFHLFDHCDAELQQHKRGHHQLGDLSPDRQLHALYHLLPDGLKRLQQLVGISQQLYGHAGGDDCRCGCIDQRGCGRWDRQLHNAFRSPGSSAYDRRHHIHQAGDLLGTERDYLSQCVSARSRRRSDKGDFDR